MWAPDAYEGAPTPVTAFMAAGVKAAAFGALIRLFGTAFAQPGAGLRLHRLGLGAVGAGGADHDARQPGGAPPGQHQAHAGLLVDRARRLPADRRGGGGPGRRRRQPAVLFYLLAYTFTTLGAFGVVAWIGNRSDERLYIDDWAGLGAARPAAALAMTLFLLSLGGMPPTGGFFGKFYLFRAAMETPQLYWLVVDRRPQQRGQRLLLPARRRRHVLPRRRAAASRRPTASRCARGCC